MKQATLSRDEVFALIKERSYQLKFRAEIPEEWQSDREIVIAALRHGRAEITDLPAVLVDDRAVMFAFARRGSTNLGEMAEIWRDDQTFVADLLAESPGCFEHASERLRADRTVAMLAVAHKNVNNLAHVAVSLRHDRELLNAALKGHKQAFLHVPVELRADPAFLSLAIEHSDGNSLVFEAMPPATRDDKQVALSMVSRDGSGFRYASERLRDDKELLLAALPTSVRAIETASPRLRADVDVVRFVASHKNCREAFRYLDEAARNAPDIVPIAVAHGADLEHFDERWRDDEPTVRAAVGRWGRHYRAASPRLQATREIALLAAEDHARGMTWGFQLEWVPEELRGDREIAFHAVQSVVENAKALPSTLLADVEFIRKIVAKSDRVLQYLPEALRREVALCRIHTAVHFERSMIVEAVPETGYVQNGRRSVERVVVRDGSGRSLVVESVPVVTYEEDGPVGSYLSVRFVNKLVMCGRFLFLIQHNSGQETYTSTYESKDAAERQRRLWHHVFLVPWHASDGDVKESFESLRARSIPVYVGLLPKLPEGVTHFVDASSYDEAMSIVGGANRRESRFTVSGPRELRVGDASATAQLAGAARVHVGGPDAPGPGWRWLLPHAEGPRAALEVLRRTHDVDDWAWLAPHVEVATGTQRVLLIRHFADTSIAADVLAACTRFDVADSRSVRAALDVASGFASDRRFAEAVALAREVVQAQERAFGVASPATIEGRCALAAILEMSGEPGEAVTLHEAVLGEIAAIQWRSVAAISRMANEHTKSDPAGAAEWLLRDWSARATALAGMPVSAAEDFDSLALAMLNAGQFAAAERAARIAVAIRQERVGSDDMDLLVSMNALAFALVEQRKSSEARPYAARCAAAAGRRKGWRGPWFELALGLCDVLDGKGDEEVAKVIARLDAAADATDERKASARARLGRARSV
jgi:hypothetical protein